VTCSHRLGKVYEFCWSIDRRGWSRTEAELINSADSTRVVKAKRLMMETNTEAERKMQAATHRALCDLQS
jgi:hypothetical protein